MACAGRSGRGRRGVHWRTVVVSAFTQRAHSLSRGLPRAWEHVRPWLNSARLTMGGPQRCSCDVKSLDECCTMGCHSTGNEATRCAGREDSFSVIYSTARSLATRAVEPFTRMPGLLAAPQQRRLPAGRACKLHRPNGCCLLNVEAECCVTLHTRTLKAASSPPASNGGAVRAL